MRALVTGGAGFIGSHLVRRLVADGESVVVLDDLSTGRRENVGDVDLVCASIEDRGALRAALQGVDAVFHLAAMVSVPLSLQRPATCLRTNVVGTAAVLGEAAAAGVEVVVFASSAAVYGERDELAPGERPATHPTSPYGVSKIAGEQLAAISDSPSMRTVSLRLFNVYGPRQETQGPFASLVPALASRARRGEALTLFGDGTQTRDFLHVSDAVDAAVYCARAPTVRGIYDVGTGVEVSIAQLARQVASLVGSTAGLEHRPPRAGDVRRSVADVVPLRGAGWVASMGLTEGLASTVLAY